MKVGIARDHGSNGESPPVVPVGRQSKQRSQQRQRPELPQEAVEGPLLEEIAALGQRQHEDDLQRGRGDGQHVCVEGGEAEPFEGQRQVRLHGGLRDIRDEADEVQPPHGLVAPGVEDVGHGGAVVDVGEAFGGVVAEEALHLLDGTRNRGNSERETYIDHDDFLALGVPGARVENALGVGGGGGEVEEALFRSAQPSSQIQRHTIKPIVKVINPSIRNNQNHPVWPRTPRICRMPAARSEEIMRATYTVSTSIINLHPCF